MALSTRFSLLLQNLGSSFLKLIIVDSKDAETHLGELGCGGQRGKGGQPAAMKYPETETELACTLGGSPILGEAQRMQPWT